MKVLTKNTDYAVRALLEAALAPAGVFLSSSEIAKKQGIPLCYLRGILSSLITEGYLASKEGIHGGVRLRRKSGDIKVSDIVMLFQGEIQISECMFRKKVCANRPRCPLRKRLTVIEKKLTDELSCITLADLVNDIKAA